MSFTRSMYDNCSCKQLNKMSVASMNYRLYNGNNENCNSCLSTCGPYNANNESNSVKKIDSQKSFGTLIDVESVLMNRVKPLSDCNEVSCDTKCFKKLPKTHNKNICGSFLDEEDTRFTHPIDNYRGMSIDRFQYLPIDPQCNIYVNNSIDTRLIAKDTYRTVIPDLLDDGVTPTPKDYKPMNCRLQCKK
jgi:hypothetical protein